MKKIILIILFCILTSGCTVTYNLEIDEKNFNENIKLSYTDKNVDEFHADISLDVLMENTSKTDYPLYNNDTKFDYYTFKVLEETELYEISYANKDLYFKGNFPYNKFQNAYSINLCTDYEIAKSDDTFILKVNNFSKCFISFPLLDSININLKYDGVVTYNNADMKDGSVYTWNISKDDSLVFYYKDKTNLNNNDNSTDDGNQNNNDSLEGNNSGTLKVNNESNIFLVLIIVSIFFVGLVFISIKLRHKK